MRALTALEIELQCQALQFAFPVAAPNSLGSPRSVTSSPPESSTGSSYHRTSVIQSVPRCTTGDSAASASSAGTSGGKVAPSSPMAVTRDAENSPQPAHSRSHVPTVVASSDRRQQDNMSPEAIDLVWRKKMKLDQCYTTPMLRVRSSTDTSLESHASSVSLDGKECEFEIINQTNY